MSYLNNVSSLSASLSSAANTVSNSGHVYAPQPVNPIQVVPVQPAYPSPYYPTVNTPVASYQQNSYDSSLYGISYSPAASAQMSTSVGSMNDFVRDIVQRNAPIIDRSRELAGRYCNIQSKVDSKQEWLDNQNGFQRFWNGFNGKTRRVEREMNQYTRESVGVLAEEVSILSNQNGMLMEAIVEMGNRFERQEAIHNQQNQVFLDIIRRIGR